METKLCSKHFKSDKDLIKFINTNNIKDENIINIVKDNQEKDSYSFTLFFKADKKIEDINYYNYHDYNLQKAIEHFMLKKGFISLKKLSEITDIPYSTIYVLMGRNKDRNTKPSMYQIEKIAKSLDVSISELFRYAEECQDKN